MSSEPSAAVSPQGRAETRRSEECTELIEAARTKLSRLALRFRIPADDVDDLLQQTFLAFVLKRETIENAEAWLVGTFKRECLMYLRTRQRRLYDAIDTTLLESVADGTPAPQERDQLLRDLDQAIAHTPGKCSALLRMRYRLGYENREIADRLGYRTSSIRKIASRCMAALTQQLVGAESSLRSNQ